jgi:hypothetical protein
VNARKAPPAHVMGGCTLPGCGCGATPESAKPPARLPTDAAARKNAPVARGVLDYFPDALMAVAELSRIGNEQHNPGQPMHWAKEKSTDHADCIVRHLIERGTLDTDGQRHAAKVAWRALALLQTEIEDERTVKESEARRRADAEHPANVMAAAALEAEGFKVNRRA